VPVLTLILLVLVLWIVLVILLSAWTLWFQNAIYSEPATGIHWRGPAAGSAILLVILLWIVMDYRAPGRYRPLFESSSTEDAPPFPELRIPKPGGGEDVFLLRPNRRPGDRLEYYLNGQVTGKRLPHRPEKIIVVEGDDRSIFEPERDEKGKFKVRTRSSFFGSSTEDLRYIDGKGRVMVESSLGRVGAFRGGLFFGNLFLNFLLLGALFATLWALLHFQWPHALAQAVVLWIVLLLFVLPPVLSRAENIAKDRARERSLSG
jgi:hypothetical protein